MLSGYVLILAMLVLGGVIATVGDRIGTRVGKARLSLFNLRPRSTATLVTIMTGTVISAATFGFIFATDKRLGQALIDFQQTINQRDAARNERDKAQTEKERIEQDLTGVKQDQAAAKRLLAGTNESLKVAIAERSRALKERLQAEAETARVQSALLSTQGQLGTVSEQAMRLRSDISQLQTERNQAIALGVQELKARDDVIQQREEQLKGLEAQQESLALAIQRLQQEARNFQEGRIAIQRNQVLTYAVVRQLDRRLARQAVDQLLRKANDVVRNTIRPGSPDVQIVQIHSSDVAQLIERIGDGQEYVVRIFAAENYLMGTTNPIQISTDVVRNQVRLQKGAVIAATTIDPGSVTGAMLQERIQSLIAAANFRASSMGILADSVQINQVQNFLRFIEQLKALKQPAEIRVTAVEDTYTAGPLKVDLVTTQNGQVLFGTGE